MRVFIKGGVWKNTEDEILKAAVMKYGKNQWSRVSSLLGRKSAKQCKARWYEWLDPSIKKMEWTREEEEKLLHLAKLMPTQWRTIAPIVGRTPAQCLDRYQKLLDEAEAEGSSSGLGLAGPQGGEGAAPAADSGSSLRLRPGEIHPNPETKPARPDAIDMDDDEKDMLAEARARLANTQGKKAKRKARERQLEEARRLTALQKSRELKAAGIEIKKRKKANGMDYNADIPFEKRPAPGFYDATEELGRSNDLDLLKKRLNQIEGRKRRDQEEARKKTKKPKKGGEEGDGNIAFVPSSTNERVRQIEETEQVMQRQRLVLPAPQVTEAELEEIVKFGLANETAQELVGDSQNPSSLALLNDYRATAQRNRDVRTPQTPAIANGLMAEARSLRRMTEAPTPLLGQGATEFDTTPHAGHGIAPTPNPLLTPLRAPTGMGSGATPAPGSGRPVDVANTPYRDAFTINPTPRADSVRSTPYAGEGSMATLRASAAETKQRLAQSLLSLPAPKNEFEIVVPDAMALDDPALMAVPSTTGPVDAAYGGEDASDRDQRLRAQREKDRLRELRRRTQVVQRGLPRPQSRPVFESLPTPSRTLVALPEDVVATATAPVLDELRRLLADEMVVLMAHDRVAFPQAGDRGVVGERPTEPARYTDGELEAARQLITDEASPLPSEELASRARMELQRDWQKLVDTVHNPLAAIQDVYVTESTGESVTASSMATTTRLLEVDDPATQHRALHTLFVAYRERLVKDTQRAAKADKKLGILLGGYRARATQFQSSLTDLYATLQQMRIDTECFTTLARHESGIALPHRQQAAKELLQRAKRQEDELQQRYKQLTERREATIVNIQALMADGQPMVA
ncbi:Pre-mRNA-splicing factor cef1 [Tieghemiomyces parasiticus]|uniref:Pre-mRNA-splicing factor cef1 n=1 Tax=Tieghemiomyces parasiticus TaxID=78921 RepID=A0A9W8ADB6_9FUNG|nr:Pre-mRNA-splicing factor cef1 [Tieghemiomyces parasiticus]